MVSGYSGGHTDNPTYQEVCSETTGHAEVVQITFDPNELSFARAAARLFAAAPDDRVRDGHRALEIIQALVARQPRTIELAETMAMAAAEVGQYIAAVQSQREAIEAAERTGRRDVVGRLADNLTRYQAGRPCRMPWQADEPLEF